MIREERDPGFWINVAHHPVVSGRLGRVVPAPEMAAMIASPNILPLAAEHGGFIFTTLDHPVGRVWELHTLFTPEGWGREVHGAGKEALVRLFSGSAHVLVTNEMESNDRSRPPRSFGFIALGGFEPGPWGRARTWMLTRETWLASPAGRKVCH